LLELAGLGQERAEHVGDGKRASSPRPTVVEQRTALLEVCARLIEVFGVQVEHRDVVVRLAHERMSRPEHRAAELERLLGGLERLVVPTRDAIGGSE